MSPSEQTRSATIATRRGRLVAAGLVLALAGCVLPSSNSRVPTPNAVAGDEPVAADIAFQIMAQGGNAVDAAVAAGLAMAVTLPTRVSPGAVGTCISIDAPESISGVLGTEEPVDLTLGRFEGPALPGGQVAVPALVRGLYAFHADGGVLRWSQVVAPAEQLARFGFPLSRTLAADLEAGAAAQLRDPALRAALLAPDGTPRPVGTTVTRTELADTLSELRQAGVFGGALLDTLAAELAPANPAGAAAAIRAYIPSLSEPSEVLEAGDDLLVVGSSRVAGMLNGGPPGIGGVPGATVAALSVNNVAAACSFSLGGWFGTGTAGATTGVIPARATAAPDQVAVLYNPYTLNVLTAVAGTGGDDAFAATIRGVTEDELDAPGAVAQAAGAAGRVSAVVCPTELGAVTGCLAAAGPGDGGLARFGF
ncbi:MAG: gamma-glutamyltransferase [Rhodospirillaceae bacterium]|nr:gamma-glutamyltransferase [Rhodospirillaceae bacterium]